MKRIFLFVLDSCGIGAMPDSASFGDIGVNTLKSCTTSDKLHIPNLIAAGLGNIDGIDYLPKTENPTGAYARLTEASMGKDTTIGHWEISGLVSPEPLPTYPEGFPQEVLDAIKEAGLASIAVGKIHDIFAGYGDTEYVYNKSNTNGMEHAANYAKQDFTGLCFVNLVDFDMLYGHRRDIDGYAAALTEFDGWLGEFMQGLGEDDLVMVTADHGCDPAYTATTDHTREYVPLVILGKQVKPVNLGTRKTFADIAATVTELLGVKYETVGESFAEEIL